LAGAQNLDVQIARERASEARALHQSAVAQFFPWVSPGIAYRQHDQNLQDVQGNIVDVHKYSYAPGVALSAQVDIGDAWFKSLAARQVARAAEHALEAQRQDAVLAAATDYFDLAQAQATVGVARESLRIAVDYETQLDQAVLAGIAFKGDALRARVRKERNQLALRQAQEQQRVAAARLAQTLRLDPAVELVTADADLSPLNLITNVALDHLVARALAQRPELKQQTALTAAARESWTGARYGPLIPTIGAQAFFGGLGGGRDGVGDEFGDQQDYFVGASWRLGPGGLFDFTRTRAGEARFRASELGYEKLRDELTRQVVEVSTRWQSQLEQIGTLRRALSAAEEGLRLAQQRKEFAVGVVLETLQAEEDLTRARLDYLKAVAEVNRSQYRIERVTGGL
jgi:OMF family outer membrane factor